MLRRLRRLGGGGGAAAGAALALTAAAGCAGVALHRRRRRLAPDARFGVRFGRVAGCHVPEDVHRLLPSVASFAVRDSDVFVVSFPKSGTTWMQEVVYMIASDMDELGAEARSIEERVPYLEFAYPGVARVAAQRGQRLIKSHLPLPLLPAALLADGAAAARPKVVYVARNPMDVAVSYFHFVQLLRPLLGFRGGLREFVDAFLRELPIPYGPWRQHVVQFWEASRRHDNVLFVTYEEMSADTPGCVMRVAEFLGRRLTRRQATRVADFCSFHRMRLRPSSSFSWWRAYGIQQPETGFYRSGKVGDWRRHLLPEEVEQFRLLLADIEAEHQLRLWPGAEAAS